jgi:hypothetical protein
LAAKADDPTISAPKPTVPKVARSPVATVHAGRILASPKARRLARERGIDLAALASTGVAQPIHAADLDRAPTLEAALAPQATPVPVSQTQRATAELDGGAFSGFLDWMASETGDGDDQGRRAAVLAAFAAGALREATGGGGGIAVSSPGAPERRFAEPDRGPLGTAAQAEGTVALRLRDLARTAVTGVDFAAADAPVLSLSARDERLRLDYVGALPPEQVIALLDGFATRLADPLRHIL